MLQFRIIRLITRMVAMVTGTQTTSDIQQPRKLKWSPITDKQPFRESITGCRKIVRNKIFFRKLKVIAMATILLYYRNSAILKCILTPLDQHIIMVRLLKPLVVNTLLVVCEYLYNFVMELIKIIGNHGNSNNRI